MKLARLRRSALLLGTAVLFVSCDNRPPVAPRAQPTPSRADLVGGLTDQLGNTTGQTTDDVANAARRLGLLSCSPLPYAKASAVIGPLGGVIQVGPHTLTVPAGALDRWTTITAEAPTGSINRVDFEPSGLKFERSASLRMSYANCNTLGKLLPKHIAYIGDDLGILYLLQSVDDLLAKKVTGKLDHFSDYAVSW